MGKIEQAIVIMEYFFEDLLLQHVTMTRLSNLMKTYKKIIKNWLRKT